jgi:hypothetical protein
MADAAESLPTSLYHYTDAAGLLGIIKSKTIWATDCRFLNDAQEFRYGIDVIERGLRDLPNLAALDPSHPLHDSAEEVGQAQRTLADMVLSDLTSRNSACVSCFCENGDLLSQWRGYASRHGYAIEFDRSSLEVAASRNGGFLSRVGYGEDELLDAAEHAAHAVMNNSLNHLSVTAYHIAQDMSAPIATVKHPSFSEEQEWRLVMPYYQAEGAVPGAPLEYRPTELAIVPYVKVELWLSEIVGVRVGQCAEQELRMSGVRRMLSAFEIDVPVTPSSVPFRS